MGCQSSNRLRIVEPIAIVQNTTLAKAEDYVIQPSNFVSLKSHSLQDDYSVNGKLNTGGVGTIRRVVHKVTGQMRALKTIRKSMITQEMRRKAKFFNEVDILKDADHPNIIKLYDIYEDKMSFYLVTELISGGELFDFITSRRQQSEEVVAHFMRQVLSGVNYCHKNNIIHSNLQLSLIHI